LRLQLHLHLALLPHLLHALHELLVVVEDGWLFLLGLLHPLDVSAVSVVSHAIDGDLLRGDGNSRLGHGDLDGILQLLLDGELLDRELLDRELLDRELLDGSLLDGGLLAVGELLLLRVGHLFGLFTRPGFAFPHLRYVIL
jgi:hypothetical protein